METIKVSIAQISPIWFDKQKTIEKIIGAIDHAYNDGSQLVCFGETLLPGYPYWLELTDGARFNSDIQKDIFAHYLKEAVRIEDGDLIPICKKAKECNIAIYVGIAEKALDRGGHSIYCSLVYIDQQGEIKSVHRKLMPTYEERLTWSIGDGNGLRVHPLGPFTVGGLNCWENWMPLARTSLYAQGENLHVAVWPGGLHNTLDLTRHIAKENRMYVISVSGILTKDQILDHVPHSNMIKENAPLILSNGGSCIAAPDGSWVIEPIINDEVVKTVSINLNQVRRERMNFDPNGHYSRPDVFNLAVNRDRQSLIKFSEKVDEGIFHKN
jgi:nitrilase